jgi:predicted nucleic acid-binding protein
VIVLDTDVLSHVEKQDPVGTTIRARLDAHADRDVWITVVTAYEMMGGAVRLLEKRMRERRSLGPAFRLVQETAEYLGLWRGSILPFDDQSERIHEGFAARPRQVLKQDARIAAIALASGADLWTPNTSDFRQVPGLIVTHAETGQRIH